jgi:ATP-binding cassette subfamily A (ABC1) protein 3
VSEEDRHSGSSLYLQQFYGMFLKRMLHTWRNSLVTIAQLLVPFFVLILCMIIIKTMPQLEDAPPLTLNLSHYKSNMVPYHHDVGKLNELLAAGYGDVFKQLADTQTVDLNVLQPNMSLADYLISKGTESVSRYNLQYMIASEFYSAHEALLNGSVLATAFFNAQSFHTPAISLNALDNALLHFFT